MSDTPQLIYCSPPALDNNGIMLNMRITGSAHYIPRPELGDGYAEEYTDPIDRYESSTVLSAPYTTGLSCSSEPTVYNVRIDNITVTPEADNAVPGWMYRGKVVCRYYAAVSDCNQSTCECTGDSSYKSTTEYPFEFDGGDAELPTFNLPELSRESVEISVEVCQCEC